MSRDFQWGVGEVGRPNYASTGAYETFDEQGEAYGGEQEGMLSEQEGHYGGQEALYEAPERLYGEAEYGESGQGEQEAEAVFDEAEEMELAAELLSVKDEQELDRLIRRLILSASKAVGGSISRDVGTVLGGSIKAAAKQVLPTLGGAVAGEAGELFGVEMEGLSGEDQEFESAKLLARFSGAASGRAARASRRVPPYVRARKALAAAARKYAPGLLKGSRFWQRRHRDWRGRGPGRRGDRPGMRYPGGVPAPGAGYPYQAPYPAAGMPAAPAPGQQAGPGYDPNAAAGGFAGAPDSSGGGADQGVPFSGGGQDAGADGSGGPTPQSGRWTRQGGRLTLHL